MRPHCSVNVVFSTFDEMRCDMNKFAVKERLDMAIYYSYNVIASLVHFFRFGAKRLISGNAFFKDRHKGGRCFIVGTGPSLSRLSETEIEKLKKETVFGVNHLYKSRVGERLFPRYYTIMDDTFRGDSGLLLTIAEKYSASPPAFILDFRAKKYLGSLSFQANNIYICSKKYPIKKINFDLTKNVHGLMNVVSYSIVSAIYMGFDRIYLLGCDYNSFCNFGRSHCYVQESNEMGCDQSLSYFLKYWHLTTEIHYLIAKLAREKGVEIINLTDMSLLDAYPKQSLSLVL